MSSSGRSIKILHTSDVHLKRVSDERWSALLEILSLGKQEDVDLIVVSGDLFDSASDAVNLKGELRKVFSDNPFKILVTRGNHDYNALVDGVYIGSDVVYSDNYLEPLYSTEMADIWHLPFKEQKPEYVLKELRSISSRLDKNKINLLVIHCELLDYFYDPYSYGEEGFSRYMPVHLSFFDNLGFKYILAGHFHRKFDVLKIGNDGYFVYPGSPVSITKREVGRRAVNIFELGEEPSEYLLNTKHYVEKEIEIDPLSPENPLEIVENSLLALEASEIPILSIHGYIDTEKTGVSEKSFFEGVAKILRKYGYSLEDIHDCIDVVDISRIAENRIYQDFIEILESKSELPVDDRKKIRDLLIKAFVMEQKR